MKHRRTLIIVACIVLVLGIISTIVFHIADTKLQATPDGTKGYTGVKLEAAQTALEHDQDAYGPAFGINVTKQQVEKVFPTPKGKDSRGRNLQCTQDAGTIWYYSVTVKRVSLFGITYGTKTYILCNAA